MTKKLYKKEEFKDLMELFEWTAAKNPVFHNGKFEPSSMGWTTTFLKANFKEFKKAIEPCKYKMTNQEKRPEFEKVVKPVIEFLNNYYHPHAEITIGCMGAEISEGLMNMKTDEFIKD